jgi:hypothetical protein
MTRLSQTGYWACVVVARWARATFAKLNVCLFKKTKRRETYLVFF